MGSRCSEDRWQGDRGESSRQLSLPVVRCAATCVPSSGNNPARWQWLDQSTPLLQRRVLSALCHRAASSSLCLCPFEESCRDTVHHYYRHDFTRLCDRGGVRLYETQQAIILGIRSGGGGWGEGCMQSGVHAPVGSTCQCAQAVKGATAPIQASQRSEVLSQPTSYFQANIQARFAETEVDQLRMRTYTYQSA